MVAPEEKKIMSARSQIWKPKIWMQKVQNERT